MNHKTFGNMKHPNTTNRTATTKCPISLAGAASLGKCGYGNGIAVMERISGTVLLIEDPNNINI